MAEPRKVRVCKRCSGFDVAGLKRSYAVFRFEIFGEMF